uniref:Uncharacterized protein n=1 Tax=mine drainage metagenome TaxID=410659 RepID=E6PYI9_9ZZZZ
MFQIGAEWLRLESHKKIMSRPDLGMTIDTEVLWAMVSGEEMCVQNGGRLPWIRIPAMSAVA